MEKQTDDIKSAEYVKEIARLTEERDLKDREQERYTRLWLESIKELNELKEINSNQRENLVQLQLNYGHVKAELNELKCKADRLAEALGKSYADLKYEIEQNDLDTGRFSSLQESHEALANYKNKLKE